MSNRSFRPDVRNPVLGLPAVQKIAGFEPDVRAALASLLKDLSLTVREKAQESWRKNKGPMAVYWKAVGAYAGHINRALRYPDAYLQLPDTWEETDTVALDEACRLADEEAEGWAADQAQMARA